MCGCSRTYTSTAGGCNSCRSSAVHVMRAAPGYGGQVGPARPSARLQAPRAQVSAPGEIRTFRTRRRRPAPRRQDPTRRAIGDVVEPILDVACQVALTAAGPIGWVALAAGACRIISRGVGKAIRG